MTRNAFHPADIVTALAVLAMAVAGTWVALAGPSGPLPTHWGLDGRADDFGTRETIGLLLGILAVSTAAFAGGMGIVASREDDSARVRALRAGQWVILVAIGAVAALASTASLMRLESIAGPIPMAAIGLVLLIAGAFVGRIGPNPVAGIRTPWALKSRLAWDRSNRLAGRLICLLGLAAVVASPFAPQPLGLQALIGGLVLAILAACVESWRVWSQDPERQPF